MSDNTSIYIYVVVSIIAIAILAGFLIQCKNEPYITNDRYNDPDGSFSVKHKDTRDMCLCTGGGRKVCANRQALKASYDKGNTEYQDFGKIQNKVGGPFWHNTNFNDY